MAFAHWKILILPDLTEGVVTQTRPGAAPTQPYLLRTHALVTWTLGMATYTVFSPLNMSLGGLFEATRGGVQI